MNNTIPAPPVIEPEKTKKFTKWVFRIFILFVLCLIAPALIKRIADAIPREQTSAVPVFTLICANEKNPYHYLPDAKRIILVIPPLGDCWTDWQMRPLGTPNFLFRADGKIVYQDAFEYGRVGEPKDDGPLVRDINHTHYIVARRFKNAGNETINVPVDLH